jgi:hypothetical protein
MNLQHFQNKWKYHYKKYLALTFTCLALLCLIGSGAVTIYLTFDNPSSGVGTYLSIYDFALFAIAYMLILIGNLQGSTLAYQGMLMYVFMILFSATIALIKQGSYIDFSIFKSGNALAISLFVFVLLFYVAIIVTGIMTYVRASQYLRNSYTNYPGVRTWCLLFVIFNALLYGFEPALIMVNGGNVSLLLLFLEPLSQVFIGLAIFFTVIRLKSEY